MIDILSLLIVDDDVAVRESLADVLTELGYSVKIACDGLDALKKLQQLSFDYILIDIRMPGIDGIETSRRIKKLQPNARIIITTAYASNDIYKYAEKIGIQAVLKKPLDFVQLQKQLVPIDRVKK